LEATSIDIKILFFEFRVWLHMKHCITETMAIQKFKNKTHEKPAPLRTLVGLIFTRNKICSNYSISQGIDGFISFQAMNIAPIFLLFQLCACLRMKFGNVEAVGRLQI